jgi:hypothetical protein
VAPERAAIGRQAGPLQVEIRRSAVGLAVALRPMPATVHLSFPCPSSGEDVGPSRVSRPTTKRGKPGHCPYVEVVTAKRPSRDSGAEPSGNQDERNGEAHRNRCSWLRSPKEDLDLTHPTGHGLNRGVGQLPPSAPQIRSTGRW